MFRFWILAILLNFSFLLSQSDYILEKNIRSTTDYISSDQLGNLYMVRHMEFKKIETGSYKQSNYSNVLSGKISSIDTSDPFRILLFYKDFNKIEFLDKNLAQIASPIDLNDLGYYNVSAACQSVNGGFWIFDQSLFQLIYFDQSLNITKKSSQISELIHQNEENQQVFMLEKNDYIYLGISGEGILLFDHYGTYIKTFPIIDISDFQVNNEIITYLKNGKFLAYNTSSFEEYSISLPEHNYRQIRIENRRLFVQTEEEIYIYQRNNF